MTKIHLLFIVSFLIGLAYNWTCAIYFLILLFIEIKVIQLKKEGKL